MPDRVFTPVMYTPASEQCFRYSRYGYAQGEVFEALHLYDSIYIGCSTGKQPYLPLTNSGCRWLCLHLSVNFWSHVVNTRRRQPVPVQVKFAEGAGSGLRLAARFLSGVGKSQQLIIPASQEAGGELRKRCPFQVSILKSDEAGGEVGKRFQLIHCSILEPEAGGKVGETCQTHPRLFNGAEQRG